MSLAFNMEDYALQACELYSSVSGGKALKPAATPFCPEGAFLYQDDNEEGELAGCACQVLMKCLWLARLSRPDIMKEIGDLATKVQKWTRNCAGSSVAWGRRSVATMACRARSAV